MTDRRIACIGTFNRTIVELKPLTGLNVAIEGVTFNRTIVELKPAYNVPNRRPPPPFNRTIVELKHEIVLAVVVEELAFNRTIVELKLQSSQIGELRYVHF